MRMRIRFRRLVIAAALAFGASGGLAVAQGITFSQTLTITSTAGSLSNTGGLTFCRGVVDGGTIRATFDGSTATTTVGRPINPGERLLLNNSSDIRNLNVIATSSTATTIAMSCGSGTPQAVSVIELPPTSTALPLCNALTRPAGNCR